MHECNTIHCMHACVPAGICSYVFMSIIFTYVFVRAWVRGCVGACGRARTRAFIRLHACARTISVCACMVASQITVGCLRSAGLGKILNQNAPARPYAKALLLAVTRSRIDATSACV